MLLTATLGFGTVLNTGTGAATIKQISASSGHTAKENIGKVMGASLAIGLVGGGLLAALILLIFGVAGQTLFAKMGDPTLVLLTGCIAALLTWIEQIDNVFSSALKGAEKFGYAARIEMASKTVQIFASVVAVSLWNELDALYVALVFVAIVRLWAKAWIVRKLLGLSSMRPRFANLSSVLHYAKWGWLQGVGGLFFGVADRMLVGGLLGSASLAHYSIATQLAMQIHALSAAGFSVIFPKVSRKLEGDANFSLREITMLTTAGNVLASTILALGLLVFGEQILIFWLGVNEAEACREVLWYLTIAYWLLALNVTPHFILLAVSRQRFVALSNTFAGIFSLALMYILIRQEGMVGVGLARIAYGIIILVNYLSLFEYLFGGAKNHVK